MSTGAWLDPMFSGAELVRRAGWVQPSRVEYTPTADLVRCGALALRQADIGAMEAAATRIGEYQPAMLPGLVQIPAYSRALLELPGSARSKGASDADLDRIITARARRQELLREPGRRWQFVIDEAALWSAPAGEQVQRAQLDHLTRGQCSARR